MGLLMLLMLAAEPLPDGVSYVPRLGRWQVARGDGAGRVTRSFEVRCERLEVAGPLVTLGAVTFTQRSGDLGAPVHRSPLRRLELRGSCATPVPTGPRFEDRERCSASPPRATETCVGQDCSLDVRVFALGGCDAELARLEALAELVLDASHADAWKTVERLKVVTARGGKLWLLDAGACVPLTVKPGRDGSAQLESTPWQAEVFLEPLFGQARVVSERGSSGDGRGGWGGGPSTTTLSVGNGLVLVGSRALFLDEARCSAR